MLAQRMMMAAAAAVTVGYETDAVNFDGTNDFLRRSAALTGAVDTDTITAVLWIDFTGGDAFRTYLLAGFNGGAKRFDIHKNTSNKIQITCRTAGNSTITVLVSTTTYTAADGWKCFLFSKSGTTLHLFEKDTDIADTPSTNSAGDVGVGNANDWEVAAVNEAEKANANYADLWYNDEYIDFSVEANRRKFVDASGKPVDLGADGSTPTSAVPLIFQRRVPGASTASYATNKGDGGGLTENGTLTDTTNGSPSD